MGLKTYYVFSIQLFILSEMYEIISSGIRKQWVKELCMLCSLSFEAYFAIDWKQNAINLVKFELLTQFVLDSFK